MTLNRLFLLHLPLDFLITGFARYSELIFSGKQVSSVSFDLRSDMENGLIFFAHGGKKVFVLIQMRVRVLEAVVSNVDRFISLKVNASRVACNGTWYHVSLRVWEVRAVLQVGDLPPAAHNLKDPITNPIKFTLSSPLFLGGIDTKDMMASASVRSNNLSSILAAREYLI